MKAKTLLLAGLAAAVVYKVVKGTQANAQVTQKQTLTDEQVLQQTNSNASYWWKLIPSGLIKGYLIPDHVTTKAEMAANLTHVFQVTGRTDFMFTDLIAWKGPTEADGPAAYNVAAYNQAGIQFAGGAMPQAEIFRGEQGITGAMGLGDYNFTNLNRGYNTFFSQRQEDWRNLGHVPFSPRIWQVQGHPGQVPAKSWRVIEGQVAVENLAPYPAAYWRGAQGITGAYMPGAARPVVQRGRPIPQQMVTLRQAQRQTVTQLQARPGQARPVNRPVQVMPVRRSGAQPGSLLDL